MGVGEGSKMKYTALRHQLDELMERLKPRGSIIRIVGGLGPHPDATDVPEQPATVMTKNDRGVDVHESPQMAADCHAWERPFGARGV